jgi:nucleotide-binding universal stress UspA family protein
MKENVILVPTDFSMVAECATMHAGMIAAKSNHQIVLVHIITKEKKQEINKGKISEGELLDKLILQAKYLQSKFNVQIDYLLREGSIFTSISEVASEKKATLIVMGTHGVKGMQHITGAYAIKVISSSKVPIIIVQNKLPAFDSYQIIVSPIDDTIETRQKTMQTLALANIFESQVHLFKMRSSDEMTEDRIRLNLNYVKKYLKDHEVNHLIAEQPQKAGDFSKCFLRYADEVSADIIIILTTAEKGMLEIVLGPVEQTVINNPQQIPVMCVNSLQSIYKKAYK